MGKLFGTDGIRGEANVPPMTPDMALKLGRALAGRLGESRRRDSGRQRIVIGKDTRLSGYMFEHAIAAGINAMGVDSLLSGPLPTPGIAFVTRSFRADAGVVISASHNAFHDNGIKLFGPDGFKLPDEDETEIERMVLEDTFARQGVTRAAVGKSYRVKEAWARYVVFLKRVLPEGLELDGLTIVVDCAHGAAYKVAPAVFEELGARVFTLGCAPDGTNINHGYGSLHPERMCATVRECRADLGIALDGDADRVIVADENGNIVDGDQLMAISALRMAAEDRLPGKTLVATVMSNLGLELAMKRAGLNLLRTQVGDRHVVEAMRRGGYTLGGEQSGHLVYLDHTSTGDGVVAALKTITVMLQENKPLSALARAMERVPQVLVNVKVDRKPPIADLPRVAALIKSAEATLGEEGRILVRYSGTEPKARVMLEGTDEQQIRVLGEEIAACLQREVNA